MNPEKHSQPAVEPSEQSARHVVRINPSHITKLNGRDYILFAGLLEEAHRQGLKTVRTQLIQSPSASEPTAIVSAEVTTERGTFHGLGDASPDNVNRWIAPHVIRMAETRALARAFRFATNIGLTAFEELGNDQSNGRTNNRHHNSVLVQMPPVGLSCWCRNALGYHSSAVPRQPQSHPRSARPRHKVLHQGRAVSPWRRLVYRQS